MKVRSKVDKKSQIENISALLKPYCKKEDILLFNQKCKDEPVSGFILNPSFHGLKELLSDYPNIEADKEDALSFYFQKSTSPLGKSIYQAGGAFYIMDPSSSLISRYLVDILPQSPLVLDLCAAPGGKSIALSFRRRDALILANDISYQRAKEITKNVERLGITNIFALSYDPVDLPSLIVDCVILDAPCSGSGMFRKDSKMLEDWSQAKVDRLLPIQENLLEIAYKRLKKGGILAYSTCSLSIEEDEGQVTSFLKRHNDCELIEIPASSGMIRGKDNVGIHLIPGIYKGEGIYFALIKKKGDEIIDKTEIKYDGKRKETKYKTFSYNNKMVIADKMYTSLLKLRFINVGIQVYDDAQYAKCPYYYPYSKLADDIPLVELTKEEATSYLHGEEIRKKVECNGLVILTYASMRLGFGKVYQNRIKNYLPKGVRI